MTDEQALKLLIKQGRKFMRTISGARTLRYSLMERAAKHQDVESEWLLPALEVLEFVTDNTCEWFEERLRVAEGEPL